uniref:Uncharacterized protein n=1 Tax=Arundo donax TaxID=35708 RepID=A0A0A9B1X8_ARUDO
MSTTKLDFDTFQVRMYVTRLKQVLFLFQ